MMKIVYGKRIVAVGPVFIAYPYRLWYPRWNNTKQVHFNTYYANDDGSASG